VNPTNIFKVFHKVIVVSTGDKFDKVFAEEILSELDLVVVQVERVQVLCDVTVETFTADQKGFLCDIE
jgi:hypothetical protein